jgi:hypothetical protein
MPQASPAAAAMEQQEEDVEELSPELDGELEARMAEILQEREAELKVQQVVEQILNTAQEWEYSGRQREALDLLRQGGVGCRQPQGQADFKGAAPAEAAQALLQTSTPSNDISMPASWARAVVGLGSRL